MLGERKKYNAPLMILDTIKGKSTTVAASSIYGKGKGNVNTLNKCIKVNSEPTLRKRNGIEQREQEERIRKRKQMYYRVYYPLYLFTSLKKKRK